MGYFFYMWPLLESVRTFYTCLLSFISCFNTSPVSFILSTFPSNVQQVYTYIFKIILICLFIVNYKIFYIILYGRRGKGFHALFFCSQNIFAEYFREWEPSGESFCNPTPWYRDCWVCICAVRVSIQTLNCLYLNKR